MRLLLRHATPLLGAFLAFGISSAADQKPAPPESRCAVLTWPDGRQTKIGGFDENVRFLEACEKTPGKCKLDNVPFPAKDPKGRSAARVLADAATECIEPAETKPEATVPDKTPPDKGLPAKRPK
jgi:hypothetical protein